MIPGVGDFSRVRASELLQHQYSTIDTGHRAIVRIRARRYHGVSTALVKSPRRIARGRRQGHRARTPRARGAFRFDHQNRTDSAITAIPMDVQLGDVKCTRRWREMHARAQPIAAGERNDAEPEYAQDVDNERKRHSIADLAARLHQTDDAIVTHRDSRVHQRRTIRHARIH